MPFISVSQSSTLRFNEVRALLTEIRSRETIPPAPETEIVSTLRGLFFVNLYGAFEFSITEAVQTLLQEITRACIPYSQFEPLFHAVALDGKFSAISDAGRKKKWKARRELLSQQVSATVCGLNDTAFHHDLQNIWFETLSMLFDALCIAEPVVPEARLRGYIDEVVDRRNAVAHGRESPALIGRIRSTELELRLDAISQTATHVILCFDKHLANRGFVTLTYRNPPFAAAPA